MCMKPDRDKLYTIGEIGCDTHAHVCKCSDAYYQPSALRPCLSHCFYVGDPNGPVNDLTGPVGDPTGPARDPTRPVEDPTGLDGDPT